MKDKMPIDTRMSLCMQCKRDFKCKAWEDDVEVTMFVHGMTVKASFKEMYQTSMFYWCPINEFEGLEVKMTDQSTL